MSVSNLKRAVTRAGTVRPYQRENAVARVLTNGVAVADRRDELAAKLDRQWAWLDAHPDHDKFAEREDEWLVNLREYERCVDALAAALEAVRA